jgi:hypothetical protein
MNEQVREIPVKVGLENCVHLWIIISFAGFQPSPSELQSRFFLASFRWTPQFGWLLLP